MGHHDMDRGSSLSSVRMAAWGSFSSFLVVVGELES